jgi:hypothetical protein
MYATLRQFIPRMPLRHNVIGFAHTVQSPPIIVEKRRSSSSR